VKIVADIHMLVLYLLTPDRLTDTALEARTSKCRQETGGPSR
jgi:hypothetical protein